LEKVKANASSIIIGTMRLGIWGANYNTQQMHQFIEQCLALGICDFDLADIYGHYTTEADFGLVLKDRSSLREKLFITTKCGIQLITENRPKHQIKSYNSTKSHILQSVETSLKNLHTEYIDVLLIHRPDFLMQPSEIAEAFLNLNTAGKVNAFGVSNFTASQFDLLNTFTPLITNQLEISAFHLNAFNDGTLNQCLKLGITPTAWSPLGGGAFFTDKNNEQVQRLKPVIKKLAEKYNCSNDELLLAWLKKHSSGIVPVIGTSKIERVKAALKAQSINIAHEDWYKVWEASTGEEVA